MNLIPLSHRASLPEFDRQARALFDAWRAGDADALRLFHHRHPRFLDPDVPWKPADLPDEVIRAAGLGPDDARLAIARWYDYADWTRLAEHVVALADPDGLVARFEAAVEAVVEGDLAALQELLRHDADLVRARSTRVTHFDPPVHGATLLHYVAANGVEGFRQKTPPDAVEIATTLLEAGAEPDALAGLYGGECTTMTLLVSSCHPADAGLQVALVETLADYGASVNPAGSGAWASPLVTALVFGYGDAAEALVRRGARVETLTAAAGLGRIDDARRLLEASDAAERHRALALAAQNGHADLVGLLLDAGEDPDRRNPDGFHSHSTPLHQAALAGHLDVVRLLVERGARLDIEDTLWNSTPLGWALHGEQPAVAEYLRAAGRAHGEP
jgi:ankyrin repeat protein